MIRTLLAASALALVAAPAMAQMPTPSAGMMTAADVGVSPLAGVSATDYVKLAADSDNFEIQSGRLAAMRSKTPAIKSMGKELVADHMTTSKSLAAALKNGDRTIARPSTKLSTDNAAKLALLKKAPRASFDTLFLQQQVEAHQAAWALHRGYADNGTDAALKQVAASAVPVVERHIMHAKQIAPAAMTQPAM